MEDSELVYQEKGKSSLIDYIQRHSRYYRFVDLTCYPVTELIKIIEEIRSGSAKHKHE